MFWHLPSRGALNDATGLLPSAIFDELNRNVGMRMRERHRSRPASSNERPSLCSASQRPVGAPCRGRAHDLVAHARHNRLHHKNPAKSRVISGMVMMSRCLHALSQVSWRPGNDPKSRLPGQKTRQQLFLGDDMGVSDRILISESRARPCCMRRLPSASQRLVPNPPPRSLLHFARRDAMIGAAPFSQCLQPRPVRDLIPCPHLRWPTMIVSESGARLCVTSGYAGLVPSRW